jgi:hypothetical protein
MRKPNRSRAKVKKRLQFAPFRPNSDGTPLRELTRLRDDEELLVFERGGQARAMLARQMAYHHVAQGELAGQPYVITF